jgi:hypothetical protein
MAVRLTNIGQGPALGIRALGHHPNLVSEPELHATQLGPGAVSETYRPGLVLAGRLSPGEATAPYLWLRVEYWDVAERAWATVVPIAVSIVESPFGSQVVQSPLVIDYRQETFRIADTYIRQHDTLAPLDELRRDIRAGKVVESGHVLLSQSGSTLETPHGHGLRELPGPNG